MPNKLNIKTLEERFKILHNNKYQYNFDNFKNTKSIIKILCPLHGQFLQKISDHLYSRCGCPKCDITNSLTSEEFITRSILIHKNKYDYSLVRYGNNNYDKVNIICYNNNHGVFSQTPWAHMRGHGCPKCSTNRKYSLLEFIERSNSIHNNFYNYSEVEYINKNTLVSILCPNHGLFRQLPRIHLSGHGCNKCNMSKLELLVKDYLDKNNIQYVINKRFSACRNKYPLPFDFYLPDFNICIECDGIQHHEEVKFFGGLDRFESQVRLDQIKNQFCLDNKIDLIRINNHNKNNLSDLIKL